jgi:hypothetical protein
MAFAFSAWCTKPFQCGIISRIGGYYAFFWITPAWCAIGELQTDLANDIMSDTSWNIPDLTSPVVPEVETPHIERLPDNVPFGVAKPTMVLPPPQEYGSSDAFLDDINTIVVDMHNYCDRAMQAVYQSVEVIGRPMFQEHIPRDPLKERKKTLIQGNPCEIKLFLGWVCNYRALMVSLPADKQRAWSADIQSTIDAGYISKKNLERLIGRLSHAATVIPMARFYLGRFYSKLAKFKDYL